MSLPTGRKFLEVYLQRETNAQNHYQIITVLNHLGQAILSNADRLSKHMVSTLRVASKGRTSNGSRVEPPILKADARLLGHPELLRQYLVERNFKEKAVVSYPSLLRRFLKLSGFLNVVHPALAEARRRVYAADWQPLIDLVDRSGLTPQARSFFRLLAEWATSLQLPPKPELFSENSKAFYEWVRNQPKRFRYPNDTYNQTKFYLGILRRLKGFPAFALQSRAAERVGLSFSEWPTAIQGEWEGLVAKWKASDLKRGKHIGPLRPASVTNNTSHLSRFLAYLRDMDGMTHVRFAELSLKDVFTPQLVLAHGKAMQSRMTARDEKIHPNLLPEEIGKPTDTIAHWYRVAAALMKHDLTLSADQQQPVRDAAAIAEAQKRSVREKEAAMVLARDLEKIPQELYARRVEHERNLIDQCKKMGLADRNHPEHMTPELSARIFAQGRRHTPSSIRNRPIVAAWNWCAALVSKELMFWTRRYRPLRSRNFVEMRWHVNIIKHPQEGWFMRYTRTQMKALRSGLKEWRMPFPDMLVPLLDYWKNCYHPWYWNREHQRNESFVFLTHTGRPYGISGFGSLFKSWARFVLGKETWAHLWRDIVVLELLKLHHRDFIVVADMIGDTPGTVEKFYNRWQPLMSSKICDAAWEAQAAGADVAGTRDLIRNLLAGLLSTREMTLQRKHHLAKALSDELDQLKECLAALDWGTAIKADPDIEGASPPRSLVPVLNERAIHHN